MPEFVHLHNHTQYSLLDGAARIDKLIEKAVEENQKAIAITDHGNMFGAPEFYFKAKKKGIKPIIGSEFYITPTSMYEKDTTERYHLILLAKNLTGYKNLVKLSSKSFLDGYYYKPRIDRELLRKHSEGLVALTACIKGEVPNAAIKGDYQRSRRLIDEYVDIFGNDFYLELQNHGIKEELIANNALIEFAKEKNVKLVATNDIHYINQSDAAAHDLLLCLATKSKVGDVGRMKFTTDEVYFKSSLQMAELFKELPIAIENTVRIADSIDFDWKFGDLLLPHFKIPQNFQTMDDYLHHLVYEGAKMRFSDLSSEVQERLQYELQVIKKMGYAGYFLIVSDFINEGRKLGASFGPGRGSAAGSLVSYCLGITNINPLRFNLLFERFLNPDRISMPDIDIDIDDKNRMRVIDYVVNKYGRESVTQIITFGTMGAKGAIKDVGRVLDIQPAIMNEITKLITNGPDVVLAKELTENTQLQEHLAKSDPNISKVIEFAKILEGSARQTGIHAAGVVIAPGDLTEFIPLYKSMNKANKDEITTQYDKDYTEKIGLLKMDFLGLKTLSIIEDSIRMVKENYDIEVDLNNLPEDDPKTWELFQKGETIGIFQFESDGMREYLKQLHPVSIEELTAMNALYRPGPLSSGMIPQFINRKNDHSKIAYIHPSLESILKETYGTIVYQEQVMKIAQTLAGFTMGNADVLRKIMGKKDKEKMPEQRILFIEGSVKNGIDKKLAEDVFTDMEKFAQYGFNKSHSAAYAFLAFQTGYLKANFPKEFMASCLNSELSDNKRIVTLIYECKKMGIDVLPPDINESDINFSVVGQSIRFGMAAVKNVGVGSVENIIQARKSKDRFISFFDFVKKNDLRHINKKVLESLIQAGAFDSVFGHRAQKFNAIEMAIAHAQTISANNTLGQNNLFDSMLSDHSDTVGSHEPNLPEVESWSKKDLLTREKEVLGFSISGHVLDSYLAEYESFSKVKLNAITEDMIGQITDIVGIITSVTQKVDKRGNLMAFIRVEDFYSEIECIIFSKTYDRLKTIITEEQVVRVRGKIDGQNESDNYKIIVDELTLIDSIRESHSGSLRIRVNTQNLTIDKAKQLTDVLNSFRGNSRVYLELASSETTQPILTLVKNLTVDPSKNLIDKIKHLLGEQSIRYLN